MIHKNLGDADPALSSPDAGSSESDHSEVEDHVLLIQSKLPRRVKVYLLQGDDWLDNGTGYCMGKVDLETHKPYFIVRNELDSEDVILRSYLEGCIQYQRQQETLIVWSDSSGKDLALSFQENEGCADLCDFIVKVQQENLSPMISLYYVITSLVQDGNGSTEGSREITELIAGPITYPPEQPTREELSKMLDIFAQASNSLYSRFKMLSFVVEHEYFSRLNSLFCTCEEQQDLVGLHFLNDIVKTILFYNEVIIFNDIFSNEQSIRALASILEYDREHPSHKAEHRTALQEEFKFECLRKLEGVPLFPGLNISILRMESILVYFRTVFMATAFEDHVVNTISSMIYKCQLDILNHLRRSQANGNFLEALFLNFDSSNLGLEHKREIIKMIHYFAMVAKCHVASIKPEFFGCLIKNGLSKMITAALQDINPEIRALGTELVLTILDQDVTCNSAPPTNESHVDELEDIDDHSTDSLHNEEATPQPLRLQLINDVSLSVALGNVLLKSREAGLQIQAYEALKSILYAASAEISVDTDSQNSDKLPRKTDSPKFVDFSKKPYQSFYESVAPKIFEDFIHLDSSENAIREKAAQNFIQNPEVYQYICDIISYCCREHDFQMCRQYLLERGLIKGIFKLLELKTNVLLKLAAVRCLKGIICIKEAEITEHIVQHDLFKSFFAFFETVVTHNSCSNSLCIDLLFLIEKNAVDQSGSHLAAYIYLNYREFLETKLDYLSSRDLLLKSLKAKLSSVSSDYSIGKKIISTEVVTSHIGNGSNEAVSMEEPGEEVQATEEHKAVNVFKEKQNKNGIAKRQRDEKDELDDVRDDYSFGVKTSKRKTSVLWADKANIEEEACT